MQLFIVSHPRRSGSYGRRLRKWQEYRHIQLPSAQKMLARASSRVIATCTSKALRSTQLWRRRPSAPISHTAVPVISIEAPFGCVPIRPLFRPVTRQRDATRLPSWLKGLSRARERLRYYSTTPPVGTRPSQSALRDAEKCRLISGDLRTGLPAPVTSRYLTGRLTRRVLSMCPKVRIGCKVVVRLANPPFDLVNSYYARHAKVTCRKQTGGTGRFDDRRLCLEASHRRP